MAGGGGGAWKVAYADFVTAMMAFFMVMWLTTQKEGVKEAVAGYFREPFATFRSNEKGAAATAKPVEEPMYGHTAQPQKRILAKAGKDQDYQFTVLFPVGVAVLEPSELESIRAFAPTMTGKLNRIEVRAHSIRHPLPKDGSIQDHWQLCYQRCRAVQQELEAQGIEAERIRLSQAESNEPLSLNLSPEELKLNSRVDVMLLSDLAELPWERQQGRSATAKKPHASAPDDHGHEGHGREGHGHDDHEHADAADGATGDAAHGHEGEHGAPSHDPSAGAEHQSSEPSHGNEGHDSAPVTETTHDSHAEDAIGHAAEGGEHHDSAPVHDQHADHPEESAPEHSEQAPPAHGDSSHAPAAHGH